MEKKKEKLKVDISTIRRESKKRKRTEEQPESPDAVWDITATTTDVIDKL